MKSQSHNPFRELASSDEFELLCRDLLNKSANVEGAMKLFKQGSKQFGADVVAFERNGTGLIVGQCKWYIDSPFSAADFTKSVEEFLVHWETVWEKNRVIRFILYIAKPLTNIEQVGSYQTARETFHKIGVAFEVLDEQLLREELKPHRDIVRRWLELEYWEEKLCGKEGRESDGFVPSAIEKTFLTRNLEQQTSLLFQALRDPIERVRQQARSGDVENAIKGLGVLKEQYFAHVDGAARAELLSLEIRISFPLRMGTEKARGLLAQIRTEDSDFDTTYISALIAAEDVGYGEALNMLSVPKDVTTFNLRLAFLLNLGRGSQVCTDFETSNISPNAETKRLCAMGLLVAGRLAEAEKIAQEAYEEEPEWEGVRLARALILYHASLSPQVLSENPLVFPSPQPWQLVKSDDESAAKRRSAAELFRGILDTGSPREDSRRLLQTWYLACLADDYEELEAASVYVDEVLESDPTNVYVVIWALTRNLKIDFSVTQAAFQRKFAGRTAEQSGDVNECIVPMALYLRDGRVTKARTHFLRVKSILSSLGEPSVLAYWNCQIAIAEGKAIQVDQAFSLKIEDVDLRQRVQVAALLASYHQNRSRKTRRKLTMRLLKFYRKTGDAHYLSLYCQISYGEKKWDDIAKYADRLLAKTQTGESLYLVCSAFHASKREGKCLEYLERYKHFFPKGDLPAPLRRLKAYGLLHAGKIAQASDEARRLWETEPSPDNFITLVETHRHLGDSYHIQKAVSEQNLSALSPGQKLRLAQILAPDNTELAAKILRQTLPAIRETKTLLDAAFYQGKQLGLDSEVDELVPQIFARAKAGSDNNSRLLTLAETLDMMSERSKQLHELDLSYRHGDIPLHIYCEERGVPLSHLLHQTPNINATVEHAATRYPILIRSAARTDSRDAAVDFSPDGKYYFDVATLLVAHHLELLPLIERLRTPIFVSNEVIPFLDAEINQIRNIPPSRERSARAITKLVIDKKLTLLDSVRSLTTTELEHYGDLLQRGLGNRDLTIIANAIDRSAAMITYLPLHNHDSKERDFELPPELSSTVTDWSTLVYKLLSEKCLDVETEKAARNMVKNKAISDLEKVPFGSTLILSGLAITQYAELDVLDELCSRYHVLLDFQDFAILKNDLTAAEQQEELVSWVQTLKSRLSNGFEEGIYAGIPLDNVSLDAKLPQKIQDDYRTKPLFQLLGLQDDSPGVAFVDDRWLTSFSTINHKYPLLSVYETLQVLKRAALITDEQIAAKLTKLRNENFCYIPLKSDELLSFIQSNAEDAVEAAFRNPALATLRKYYSLHLSDERWLKKPPPNQSNNNYLAEMEFVFGYQRAVLDALSSIWQDAASTEDAISAADALFYNFYLGRFGVNHFYPNRSDPNESAMHRASDYVDLCLLGLSFLTLKTFTSEQRLERLAAYLQWVENIFHVDLISRTGFVDFVVRHLETYLKLSLDAQTRIDVDQEQAYENLFVALQLQLFDYLPDIVREKLYESPVLRDSFDFKTETVVTIGKYQFEAVALWKAISGALLGDATSIKPRLVEETLCVERKPEVNGSSASVTLTDTDGNVFDVGGSIVGLQLQTKTLRLNYIKSLRASLDCDDEEFGEGAERIASIEDPSERATAFNSWITSSMSVAYENLESQIQNRKGFVFREIEGQPIGGLPAYFRFTSDKNTETFDDRVQHGAGVVLKELGIKEALNRFSLLPRTLPGVLVDALCSIPIAERVAIVRDLKGGWLSPVGRMHYLYLALATSSEDPETIASVEDELSRIRDVDAALEFEIFGTVLDLVEVIINRTGVASEWTVLDELAMTWAHASKLTNMILHIADDKPEELPKLLEFLGSLLPMWHGRIFDVDGDYNRDVLSPRACGREIFVGCSFGKLLKGMDSSLLGRLGVFETIKQVCFRELRGASVPKYPFWSDITQRINGTTSWLGIDGYEEFCILMSEQEGISVFLPNSISEFVVSAAETLANKHSSEQWRSLIFTASGTLANERVVTALSAIVENLDFPSLWNEDKQLAMAALSFLATQWVSLDDEYRRKIMRLLRWVAEHMEAAYSFESADRFKDEELQRDVAHQIAQVAMLTCQGSDTVAESSRRWNEAILEMGSIWPNLHLLLEYLFFRLGLEEPLSHIQGLSKNVLRARMAR